MILLCVNLDHVATIREARREGYPSLLEACSIAETSGADGITLHLREDRRHTQDKDMPEIRKATKGRFTMEMAATEEMLKIAEDIKPNLLTLVPEKRQEITTEGGLNVIKEEKYLRDYIKEAHKKGLEISLFIEPDLKIIEKSKELGSDRIELHTGVYANSQNQDFELKRLCDAAELAHSIGLRVNAGHALNKNNLKKILNVPYIEELHIGHSIVARALFIGLAEAVKEIKNQLL